jgi:hypothetical protein
MAFTRFETDTANISKLSDRPNQNDGLSSTQVKGLFDKSGNDLKAYNNDVLLEELERTTDGDSGADNIGATAVGDGTATTVQGILEEIDTAAVHKTGDETIAGVKTFSDSPIVPAPTANTQAATKKYVDDKDASVVHKDVDGENITGLKNFIGSFNVVSVNNNLQGAVGAAGDALYLNASDQSTSPTKSASLRIEPSDEMNALLFKGGNDYTYKKVWHEGNDGTGSGLDADKLDGKQDADMVHKAGTETITGVKTFSASPVVPTPTADTNPATKKYVDDADALKVDIADIVNDLTTGGTVVPLSAEQGKTLKGEVGTLASLSTTEKGSLVGAINEVDGHADTNATSIGTLASLTTTEKTNLVGAINELNADKIETTAIANILTEMEEGKVLDARQGKALKDLVDTISPYVGDGTVVKDLTFNNDWKSGTPTIDPSTGVITLVGHGFVNTDAVEFGAGTGVLPTGISSYDSVAGWNTYYNVINATTDTFQITNVILGTTPVVPSDAGISGWQVRSGQLYATNVTDLNLSTDIAYEIICILPFVRIASSSFSEILFRPYDENYTYLTGGFIDRKFPRYQSFMLCDGVSSLANTSKHVMCVAKVKVTKVGTKIFYDIASSLNVSKEDIDTKTINRVYSKNVAITFEDANNFTSFSISTSWTTAYMSGNGSRIIVRKVSI